MKLVTLMSLNDYRDDVRRLFESHEVKIYSELEITGHTSDTIRRYGWWVFEKSEFPMYSTLYFAVVEDDKAIAIMSDIGRLQEKGDPQHPTRAFQVNVEKMI